MSEHIKKIINTPDDQGVHTDEMCHVVEQHILEVKNKKVKIILPDQNHPFWGTLPKEFFAAQVLKPHVDALSYAYTVSKVYFLNKYADNA